MHRQVELPILYFGTPVAVISTLNDDNTPNLAPMSSAWWLGQSCMLGLAAASKTAQNLVRRRECVINMPSQAEVSYINNLAWTTGANPVPEYKAKMGYRFEADKFSISGFTRLESHSVQPPRIAECPVHLEGTVHDWHEFGDRVTAIAFEVHITRVHIDEQILAGGAHDRIDPERWKPLIMSFCEFFGLTGKVESSRLARYAELARRR